MKRILLGCSTHRAHAPEHWAGTRPPPPTDPGLCPSRENIPNSICRHKRPEQGPVCSCLLVLAISSTPSTTSEYEKGCAPMGFHPYGDKELSGGPHGPFTLTPALCPKAVLNQAVLGANTLQILPLLFLSTPDHASCMEQGPDLAIL